MHIRWKPYFPFLYRVGNGWNLHKCSNEWAFGSSACRCELMIPKSAFYKRLNTTWWNSPLKTCKVCQIFQPLKTINQASYIGSYVGLGALEFFQNYKNRPGASGHAHSRILSQLVKRVPTLLLPTSCSQPLLLPTPPAPNPGDSMTTPAIPNPTSALPLFHPLHYVIILNWNINKHIGPKKDET